MPEKKAQLNRMKKTPKLNNNFSMMAFHSIFEKKTKYETIKKYFIRDMGTII